VEELYDYLTVRMKVLASSRQDFLRVQAAALVRVERKAEVPDWISAPFQSPRSAE